MIKVTLLPAKLLVGEAADLVVQFENTEPGTCTQIIFTLTLPREIMLLRGQETVELDRLESGETRTHAFRVQPTSAVRCLVTSTNFSYRDRYGAARRVADFRAELVTTVPERGAAPTGYQPAGEGRPPMAEAAVGADFVTAELPYGEWTWLEGRLTNSGDIDLVDVELTITGPLKVEKRGRKVSLGTVPRDASVRFVFPVCADQSAGNLPIYLDVSFFAQGKRCTRELVRAVRAGRGHPSPPAQEDREPVVLFFGANPVNLEPLRIDKEFQVIVDALEEGTGGIRIKMHPSLAAGIDNIRRELLRRKPWIVHFAGHGGGVAESYAVEGGGGYAHVIPPDGLARLFKTAGKSVECVIINACSTEGLAQELLQHVKYVIAMTRPIEDWCAIEFSKGFYSALAAELPIKDAFELGVAQLMMVSEGSDYEIPLFLEPPI